jgi:hypothetical protein
MFLDCKVFNTSVDKFVEIKPVALGNLQQFNTLPHIALFVCKVDLSDPVKTAADTNGEPKSRKVEFSTRRGMMSHGKLSQMFHVEPSKKIAGRAPRHITFTVRRITE